MEGFLPDAEGEALHALARTVGGEGVIVEIGSWKGRSTICLARGSQLGAGVPVYAVDPHLGSAEHREWFGEVDTYDEFLANIRRAGVEQLVVPLRLPSEKAARTFDERIALPFIDGAHDLESVQRDADSWIPKLVAGGIVAFHDVSAAISWQAPRLVLRRLLRSGNYDVVRPIGSLVACRKREEPSRVAASLSVIRLTIKDVRDLSSPRSWPKLGRRASRLVRWKARGLLGRALRRS